MNAELSIQDVKARFTIFDAWAALGFAGEPKRSCRSPLRADDVRPSFSVFDSGGRFKDHATGEAGDCVDFVKLALKCDTGAALCWIRERIGDGTPQRRPETSGENKRKVKPWPVLRAGSAEELAALAKLRTLPMSAVRAASERGFLHFGLWHGVPFWAVTDAARRCVELRRMDGEPWAAWRDIPPRKAHCIGQKDWPIGLQECGPFQSVLLLEGVGDFLASFAVLQNEGREVDVAPVALLGASVRVTADAAECLAQKRVRIIGQEDDAGRRAVQEWAAALAAAGARVDAFSLAGITDDAGQSIKDLGDVFAKASAASLRANQQIQEVCPR